MPRYCQRCILPEDRPGVLLDADGVCNGCHNAERKPLIDWSGRQQAFRELCAELIAKRAGPYDCLIAVSGGKDSFWQVVTCLEHGLRPLCFTYAVPGRNALGDRNLQKLIEIGVDHHQFQLNPNVERRFIERAFRREGIAGLVTHMAVYSVPLRLALELRIPMVVYGENSAFEYGSEWKGLEGAQLSHEWLRRFGVTGGTTALDWAGDGIDPLDLEPLAYPSDDELAKGRLRAIFLGYFFPWDPENSYRVATKHGFEKSASGPLVGHYDFANIDDDFLGVHQHAKWYKFGITRSWDTLSMEIRAGRRSRDEAIAELAAGGDETPWGAIDAFCRYLRMSKGDYFETLERFRNPGVWSREDGHWKIDGFLIPDFSWADDPTPPRVERVG